MSATYILTTELDSDFEKLRSWANQHPKILVDNVLEHIFTLIVTCSDETALSEIEPWAVWSRNDRNVTLIKPVAKRPIQ